MADQLGPSFMRSIYVSDGSQSDYRSANEIERHTFSSAPVSGAWITFPDGSRFRRATDYEKSSLIRHRGNAENTLYKSATGWKTRIFTGPGGYTAGNFTSNNWAYRLSGSMGISDIRRGPSFMTMEQNEAVTKCLNELADQKANLGEGLATLGQTVRLFTNPVKGLYEACRRFRKDKSMAPYLAESFYTLVRQGVDKKIASKYLEYVYGLKPLMQDIYNLTEFAKEVGKRPLLMNSRASSKRELGNPDIESSNVSERRLERWESISGNSRHSVSLWARVDPNWTGTRTLNQLGLVNPASLVWELIPYSFVVDWFVPIGPVLQALTAPAGLIFVDGSSSRRVSARWSSSDRRYRGGEVYYNIQPATSKYEYEGYKRSQLTAWPRPGLWFDVDPLRLRSDTSDRAFKALAVGILSLR